MENYFKNAILPSGQSLAKEDISFGCLANIMVPEIKGIIYTKIFTAFMEGLNVTLDIKQTIHSFPIESIDFARILGVLLDNSIEASSATEEKYLYIGFLEREDKVYVKIKNSSNHIEDISLLFHLGASSKKGDRGIGLFDIQNIINRYENCLLYTEYENKFFIQELQLCK